MIRISKCCGIRKITESQLKQIMSYGEAERLDVVMDEAMYGGSLEKQGFRCPVRSST